MEDITRQLYRMAVDPEVQQSITAGIQLFNRISENNQTERESVEPENKTCCKPILNVQGQKKIKNKNNEVKNTFKFNNRKQNDDESFRSFLNGLRQLVTGCNFGNFADRMVRDRIVAGVRDKDLQAKLLCEDNLQLTDAIEIAMKWEDNNANPSNRYKVFDSALQQINKYITIRSECIAIYVIDYNIVRDFITNKMKEEDSVFKMLFNGPDLTGSYADGVRVSKPDEFDMLLTLKLPYHRHQLVDITKDNSRPGYVQLDLSKLMKKTQNNKDYEAFNLRFNQLLDDQNYLLQNKMQSWIESIICKVIHNNSRVANGTIAKFLDDKFYKMTYVKCGPAHTMMVAVDDRTLSIDFVPAFCFEKDAKWLATREWPNAPRTDWQVLAKPLKNYTGDNRSFTTSYAQIERSLIHDKHNLKNTLRMLKKLRDVHNLTNLKSYFIKTVFLWVNDETPGIFGSESTGYVLVRVFEKLLDFVEKRNLPFYWDVGQNMFANYSDYQMGSIHSKLKQLYKILTIQCVSDPSQLHSIFLTQDEKNGGYFAEEDESEEEEEDAKPPRAETNQRGRCVIC